MIKTLKIILSSLFSLSFWKKPKAHKHLVIMPAGSKILFDHNIVSSKETFVLDLVKYKWLNFFILINGLKKRRELMFRNNYLFIVLSYIDVLHSQYVITWMDYQVNFYKLKAYINNPIYISIQTGRRSIEPGQFFDLLRTKNYSNLSCDYVFCMGDAHAQEYGKYIKCKAISSGMVRGNFIPIGSKRLEKKEVLYVSQYRSKKNDPMVMSLDQKSFSMPWDLFYQVDKDLLPLLVEYCNKKSLKLNILSPIASNEIEEENFYNNLIGNDNYNFIKHQDSASGYNAVDGFKYIVGCESTLLYESIGRKNRTVFFDARGVEFGPFGWPLELDLKGAFWTDEVSKAEFKRLMNFLIDGSDEQWIESTDSIVKKLVSFDHDNSLLREILSE